MKNVTNGIEEKSRIRKVENGMHKMESDIWHAKNGIPNMKSGI